MLFVDQPVRPVCAGVFAPWYNLAYTRGVKTAVSLPDALFAQADETAKRLRVSRSKLYATAIARFVKEHRSRGVTERLDEVYEKEDSKVDPVLDELQLRSLPREKW